MSRSIKTILLSLIVIISASALYWFVFHPLVTKAEYSANQIRAKEAELRLIKAKVAAELKLKTILQTAQASENVSTSIIPEKLALSEIYAGIDSLSRASGLSIKDISTGQTFQPFVKNRHLEYIAVRIEGNAYFPQVIQFLDAVSKSPFLIQIENMDLSSISKGLKPRLQFKITLNAFKYASS